MINIKTELELVICTSRKDKCQIFGVRISMLLINFKMFKESLTFLLVTFPLFRPGTCMLHMRQTNIDDDKHDIKR